MNIENFIAKRLIGSSRDGRSFSRPITLISIMAIALGIMVMILSLAILTGFKREIRNKVSGFASHVQIMNFDANYSFETEPISAEQDFMPALQEMEDIEHIQVFATKAGIIQSGEQIQGVVLKGVDSGYDWDFFRINMVEGRPPQVSDTARSNEVVLSRSLCNMLHLEVSDTFTMYFVQDPPRVRRFTVAGIYETDLESFDKLYVYGDIQHIRRLNGWNENQISGFEIYLSEFDRMEELTFDIRRTVGFRLDEEAEKLKVLNIQQKYPQIFDWINLQDTNVIVILILMILVAGFNMISGLLIIILEKTNMIGILKAVGYSNGRIRKIFLYHASFLIIRGLIWGNALGIGLALLQQKAGIIRLDPSSYFLKTVPIFLNPLHIGLLNIVAMVLIILMLLIPSHLISRVRPVKAIRFD